MMWLAVIGGTQSIPTRVAEPIAVADTLDAIVLKTDLTRKAGVAVDASGPLQLSATVGAIAQVLSLLSVSKMAEVMNNSLVMLESQNPAYRMTAGILFGQLAAHLGPYSSAETVELRGRLVSLIPGAFDAKSQPHQLGLAAALSTVFKWDYPENNLGRVYAGVVHGLQLERADPECRRRAFQLLGTIVERVNKSDIEPVALLSAVRGAWEQLPFDPGFLRVLLVYTDIRPEIARFVEQSRLSIAGLFEVIGVDEAAVLRILGGLTGGEIVRGLAAVINHRQLAHCALIAMKAARQPYSAVVLKLLCEVVGVVEQTNDKTVVEFEKAILPVLIAAADQKDEEIKQLAIATIQVLVK
jgi:DNA-binding Lrp family transcriptional regulator